MIAHNRYNHFQHPTPSTPTCRSNLEKSWLKGQCHLPELRGAGHKLRRPVSVLSVKRFCWRGCSGRIIIAHHGLSVGPYRSLRS